MKNIKDMHNIGLNIDQLGNINKPVALNYLLRYQAVMCYHIALCDMDTMLKVLKKEFKTVSHCGAGSVISFAKDPKDPDSVAAAVLVELHCENQCELFVAADEYSSIAKFVKAHDKILVSKLSDTAIEVCYFHYDTARKYIQESHVNFDTGKIRPIYPGLYPGIDVELLCEDYLNSYESLLMLFGEAGLGKTTLIKILLGKLVDKGLKEVAYIKDSELLSDDSLWAMLTQRQLDLIILDDLDFQLCQRRRNDENKFVTQLMSYSDGVFETSTKIVMTTNLEIDDIDDALNRPGRCFDALKIQPLKRKYALEIWTEVLNLRKADFDASFKKDKDTIKQAKLMSEAERVNKEKRERKYVLDDDVDSVASKGKIYFKSAVGFPVPEKVQ